METSFDAISRIVASPMPPPWDKVTPAKRRRSFQAPTPRAKSKAQKAPSTSRLIHGDATVGAWRSSGGESGRGLNSGINTLTRRTTRATKEDGVNKFINHEGGTA